MKSFDEFGVENCKMVLMEERPLPKQKATQKQSTTNQYYFIFSFTPLTSSFFP